MNNCMVPLQGFRLLTLATLQPHQDGACRAAATSCQIRVIWATALKSIDAFGCILYALEVRSAANAHGGGY